MHTLQVPGQTHQAPLASGFRQAAQGELAKTEDFFDNANHRFDSAFAQTVDGLADISAEFVSHFLFGVGIFRRGCGLLGEVGLPTLVMRSAPGGDVGVDLEFFGGGDILFAEVAIIRRDRSRLARSQ